MKCRKTKTHCLNKFSFNLKRKIPKVQRRPLQIIQSLDEDPAAQNKQLTLRLQQIAAALENKVTDL